MDKICELADRIDDLAMMIYNDYHEQGIKINFLEALNKTLDYMNGQDDLMINLKEAKKLYQEITKIDLSLDEARRALFLEEIKAYRHINFNMSSITPDVMALILIHLMNIKSKSTILELGIGTGNLSSTIFTNLDKDLHFIGVEQNQDLCELVKNKANFLKMPMEIHMEDNLSFNYPNVDYIIADIDSYEYENEYYDSELYKKGVRNYSYLLMEKHLSSGKEDADAFYIVDTSFFSHNDSKLFKEFFDKYAYFKYIITLPSSFFVKETKMILIVSKRLDDKKHTTNIINLPNDNWQQILLNIRMEK